MCIRKKVIDERKFTFGRFTNDLMVSLNNHVFPCMWLCMSACMYVIGVQFDYRIWILWWATMMIEIWNGSISMAAQLMWLLSTSEKNQLTQWILRHFLIHWYRSIVSLIFSYRIRANFVLFHTFLSHKIARQSFCRANCPNFQLINQLINQRIFYEHFLDNTLSHCCCFRYLFSLFFVCAAFFNFIMSIW